MDTLMIDKITKRAVKDSSLNLAKTVSQSNSRRSERLRNTKTITNQLMKTLFLNIQ